MIDPSGRESYSDPDARRVMFERRIALVVFASKNLGTPVTREEVILHLKDSDDPRGELDRLVNGASRITAK